MNEGERERERGINDDIIGNEENDIISEAMTIVSSEREREKKKEMSEEKKSAEVS